MDTDPEAEKEQTMRGLLILAAVALLLVGGLVVFVAIDSGMEPVAAPVEPEPAAPPVKRGSRPVPHYPPMARRPQLPDRAREEKIATAGADASEQQILELGKEFHDKWYEDRRRLGEERHRQMEKLWFGGRRPRGSAKSIARLEELLREFPDTNRAGCAAYELGQHYMRLRNLPLNKRREKAEHYWRLVGERYRDTICEFNEPAAAMSQLALVNWVYRYTDPARARRLLEDIIKNDQGQTDHLGQPLPDLARRMLEVIK
ncbi:MAG: hypothetical protein DRI34_05615 [Deltaproteobacteria bacterium]|nr:MAG: hypothetical protein DRI34_05615 [Deltaproteobacteria bacterium]